MDGPFAGCMAALVQAARAAKLDVQVETSDEWHSSRTGTGTVAG